MATCWKRALEVGFLEDSVSDEVNRKFIKRADFTFAITQVAKRFTFEYTRVTKQFFCANTTVESANSDKVAKRAGRNDLFEKLRR